MISIRAGACTLVGIQISVVSSPFSSVFITPWGTIRLVIVMSRPPFALFLGVTLVGSSILTRLHLIVLLVWWIPTILFVVVVLLLVVSTLVSSVAVLLSIGLLCLCRCCGCHCREKESLTAGYSVPGPCCLCELQVTNKRKSAGS